MSNRGERRMLFLSICSTVAARGANQKASQVGWGSLGKTARWSQPVSDSAGIEIEMASDRLCKTEKRGFWEENRT